jgi:hypothetical protein
MVAKWYTIFVCICAIWLYFKLVFFILIYGGFVSIFSDSVMHSPMLDDDNARIEGDDEAFCAKQPRVIVRASDGPLYFFGVIYESVVVSAHAQMEI